MKTVRQDDWLIETGPNSALDTTPLFGVLFTKLGLDAQVRYAGLPFLRADQRSLLLEIPGIVRFLGMQLESLGVGGELMGLLVNEIVDIIEDELDIEIAGEAPGVIGTSMVKGEPAEILDIAHYMRMARPSAFSRGHARRFRILVVDDKLFFRDMLAPIVSAAGYDVSTAASAAATARVCASHGILQRFLPALPSRKVFVSCL